MGSGWEFVFDFGSKPKRIGHSHEIGERLCDEFLHQDVPMNLHRDLGKSHFCSDLLIHQAGSHQSHHLLLARAKRGKSKPQIAYPLVAFTPLPITVERYLNSIQKVLLAKWLGEEFNRASFHSLHRHRDVAVAREEDDR